MQEIKITVNDIPPSYNHFLGNSRNFNIYRKLKEEWYWLIKSSIGREKPPKPFKTSEITICYYFKDRRRHDPDNYSGKFILDALVREGVIEDDSFKNVKLVLVGDYDKENPRTEVTICEIE